jgi:hypothetical protein
MNIQFDSHISQSEAQGVILLLTALYPSLASQPATAHSPVSQLSISEPALVAASTVPGQTLVPDAAPAEPARRGRRSKAEIAADTGSAAADEAQAKAQAALAASVPVTQVQPDPTPASTPAPTADAAAPASTQSTGAVSTTAKPITKEELTALLNGHIQRHSFEAAVAVLKDFNCSRVSDAVALEPAMQAKLVAALEA